MQQHEPESVSQILICLSMWAVEKPLLSHLYADQSLGITPVCEHLVPQLACPASFPYIFDMFDINILMDQGDVVLQIVHIYLIHVNRDIPLSSVSCFSFIFFIMK